MFDDIEIGDHYVIKREIGQGGMAHVLLARDTRHERDVAVKILRPELTTAPGRARFLREIKIAASLTHPNILPLYDSGEADGLLFFVMPYIEGPSLRARIMRDTQLFVDEAIRIARDVALALDYAHRHDIVHRDIKPENIMLNDSVAMVTDFGIGKALTVAGGDPNLTRPGAMIGTPAYMSPEQIAGDPNIDGRSDIYSLGCMLYEMVSGVQPFAAPTPEAMLANRFKAPPGPLAERVDGVPPELDDAIRRAIAADRDERFDTGAAFAAALAVPTGRTVSGERTAPPANDRRSIAVLPFANLSPNPENEYFSDGITEEIINALTQVPALHVAARTSSFAFKDKAANVSEIGSKLNVESVLEGSVRRAGERIRVTAKLVNVADGYHIWSDRFDRELDDVFAIQDEIASTIVKRLQCTLTSDGEAPIAKRPTSNVDAYQLYLRGRHLWNKRTGESLEKAAGHFRSAIAHDDRFALAHAGLADVYVLMGSYRILPRADAFWKAREAAERAIALDPTLAEPHASMGQVYRGAQEWEREEREYRRAITLNPDYATAHQWYSTLLAGLGRTDEAIEAIRRAETLDPLSHAIAVTAAVVMMVSRMYEECIAQARKTLDLEPNFASAHRILSSALVHTGRFDEAREHIDRGIELVGDNPDYPLDLVYWHAKQGQIDEAVRVLDERIRPDSDPNWVGVLYANIGDLDAAFESIERGFRNDPWSLFYAKISPWYDPLRADPRFQGILDKMRLG